MMAPRAALVAAACATLILARPAAARPDGHSPTGALSVLAASFTAAATFVNPAAATSAVSPVFRTGHEDCPCVDLEKLGVVATAGSTTPVTPTCPLKVPTTVDGGGAGDCYKITALVRAALPQPSVQRAHTASTV